MLKKGTKFRKVRKRIFYEKCYAHRHLFKTRASNLKNRSLGTASATAQELSRLWKKQRGICALSGRRLNSENCQLDHIRPDSLDGAHTIENLCWTLKNANQAKSNMTLNEFVSLCKDIVEYQTLKHKTPV